MATSAQAGSLAPAATRRDGESFTHGQIVFAAGFVAAHVVLAIVLRTFPQAATAHALVTVGAGLVYTATTRRIRTIPAVVAYVVGCEVLWRMSKASVFWELGKYASAAILLIGVLRLRWNRRRLLAVAYFALLVPSIALTVIAVDPGVAREQISFNLSGPLAIALSVMFCASIQQTRAQTYVTMIALLAPVVGIAALAVRSMLRQANLEFVNASTAATSGGFAANQVSAMLGLGVLVLFLITFDRLLPWRWRVATLILAVILAAQTTLTFARGGIVLALAAIGGALFVLLRENRRARIGIILVAITTALVGKFVIEPRLEEITKGELSVRYTDASSTGRNLFIDSELQLFWDNPILGAGPGMGTEYRKEHDLFEGASHTEYSRMLGEHGLFGVLSLCCLLALCLRAVRQPTTREGRAQAVAMVVWFVLFLAVYSTRLAAPAFVFGLAFIRPAATTPNLVKARQL